VNAKKGDKKTAYHFCNLVFEGGGVKGIAYLGAMEELRKKGVLPEIKRVGGTSAGAINALLVGLNYGAEETRDVLWKLNFNNFLDDSWGIIRDSRRLLTRFGWYKGRFFRQWIGSLIGVKTGNSESTFADLEVLKEKKGFKSLYFIGTNLSTRFSEIFSNEHTPRMCVADAIRISMSIPLFFTAKRSPRGDVYVDGGLLNNYPVKLFDRKKYTADRKNQRQTGYYDRINASLKKSDRPISEYIYNRETLGFRLDSKEEISLFRDHAEPPRHKIDDFFDYAWAMIETLMESQQNSHLHSDDWQRTIYIDTLGVKTTEFDLSDVKKAALIESGREGVKKYFEWYNQSDAANKPGPSSRRIIKPQKP
jgi:NTE family protein